MSTPQPQTEPTATPSSAEPPALAFTGVLPRDLDLVAPLVQPLIDGPSRYRERDWAEFEPELRAGRMQLWLAAAPDRVRMACITQVQVRPRAKVGVVLYVTGTERQQWLGFLPVIENWFREQGCARVEIWARRGWERVLAGYAKTHSMMEKPL